MYNYSRKQFGNFLINLNTCLPYDPSIPILGIYHRKMETYIHTKTCVHSLCLLSSSVLSDSLVSPWTVARQAPLSLGFPRQEYWCGLPFPSLRDLPNPRTEPVSPALQVDSLPTEPPGKPLNWSSSPFSSVQFSRSVVSDSLRPHESQHARPPCPSPTPGDHSDSCPSSQ